MTVRTILYLPNPHLRAQTQPVVCFDSMLHELVDDMFETMYSAGGIGLAAPQIGIAKKIAVIDVSKDRSQTFCLINPEIIETRGSVQLLEEGCLSVPGVYERVPRLLDLTVKAYDVNGIVYEMPAAGVLAHCIQHEIDHLNGVIFIDHLSPLKRQLARKKFEKSKWRSQS